MRKPPVEEASAIENQHETKLPGWEENWKLWRPLCWLYRRRFSDEILVGPKHRWKTLDEIYIYTLLRLQSQRLNT